MAKQTGIHGLRGKVNGMSYYSSKNGGSLVRKINEGLGERVKSSREYFNTRKNNAEFGAAGDFAGKFIGTISQRWRFILDSIATGKMVAAAKRAIQQDASNPWGERIIPTDAYSMLRDEFNSLSKNEMPEVLASLGLSVLKFDATAGKLFASADVAVGEDLSEELNAMGADGFDIDVYHYKIGMPIYDDATNLYLKASAQLTLLNAFSVAVSDITADTDVIQANASNVDTAYSNGDTGEFNCLFILFRPKRIVNGIASVLQQHCAGAVYVPGTGTME